MIPQRSSSACRRPGPLAARRLSLGLLCLGLAGVTTLAKGTVADDAKPAAPAPLSDGWKAKGIGGEQATDRSPPEKKMPAGGASKLGAAKSMAAASADHSGKKDPLIGSADGSLAAEKAAIDKVGPKTTLEEVLARALPVRSDRPGDWFAGIEPLHRCSEPRWIDPCIPSPPCHPSQPPHPYDLIGVVGEPTDGPIYRGPCCPRTGTHDGENWAGLHRLYDRLFDGFYRTK